MSNAFNWTCPHCQRHVTITHTITGNNVTLYHNNSVGRFTLAVSFIVCPNPECEKFTLDATLYESTARPHPHEDKLGATVKVWRLIPPSSAKVYPSYIPAAILEDYTEACLIMEGSPKASSTLARRCLQGIIRDYWGVKPGRLVDEIEAIRDKMDPLTWQAIDSVRKVGNVGAHMEKDINQIVEVEPAEAKLLISLIESLFQDWYISREEKQKRLHAIVDAGDSKHMNNGDVIS